MDNKSYNISLETEIQYLKGVGPKRGIILKNIGITSIKDLIRNFPRKYIDRTNIKLINQLSIGEKTVIIGSRVGSFIGFVVGSCAGSFDGSH